ncbi:MAG: hypothetical protein NC114_10560 [Ruminococcus flavefaciens]|nr:hypothetical protein [Ruminococcus flavefaciens]
MSSPHSIRPRRSNPLLARELGIRFPIPEKVKIREAVIVQADMVYGDGEGLFPLIQFSFNSGGSLRYLTNWILFLPHSDTPKPGNCLDVCGFFISQFMRVVGVHKWSDLPGQSLRVLASRKKLHAFGHKVLNRWFCPAEHLSMLNY